MEIIHCRTLIVDRTLIELTHIGIPQEVEGFPLNIRVMLKREQLYRIPQPSQKDHSEEPLTIQEVFEGTYQTIENGLELADYVQKRLATSDITLVDITEQELPKDAFSLPEGFKEVGSVEELHLQFPEPSSGGEDWDD